MHPREADRAMAFECFCGDTFDTRQELVDHNVQAHGMERAESVRRVDEKYPR